MRSRASLSRRPEPASRDNSFHRQEDLYLNGKTQKAPLVLNRAEDGRIEVFADDGVDVFERAAHIHQDCLFQVLPPGIPTGWVHPWSAISLEDSKPSSADLREPASSTSKKPNDHRQAQPLSAAEAA